MKLEFKLQLNWLTILLALNLIMFLLARVLVSSSPTGMVYSDIVSMLGGFDFARVYTGEFWLLITSGFLHFDIIHFLVNIYSLFRIGQIVNNFYGEKALLFTYILGSLGGSLLTFATTFVDKAFLDSPYNILSYGASSGIFALIGLLLGGTLRRSRFGFSLPFGVEDILPVAAFSLLVGFIPGTNINNWAHIGGLITGLIIGLFIPHVLGYKSSKEKFSENALYWLTLILFGVSYLALVLNFIFVIFTE